MNQRPALADCNPSPIGVFDETGNGQGNNESGVIAYGASGTITLQYNQFENFPQHVRWK